nr:hypothetical protein [Paenibacillus xylanexedens]
MEQVLVVERTKFNNFINWNTPSFTTQYNKDISEIVALNHSFMNRDQAEENENYKQIIPYAFLTCGEQYLSLKRLPKQTEKRLHNKYSLGVGGHINPIDGEQYDDNNIVELGLFRELCEEIDISLEKIETTELVGVINDESNEVGKVHLGFCYRIELKDTNVKVLETDKMIGEWIQKKELKNYYENMESWSQIIIDNII